MIRITPNICFMYPDNDPDHSQNLNTCSLSYLGQIGPVGGKCGATAVWHQPTVEEAEAGLVTADVLAVWWFEERCLVIVGQVVKMAAVCRSVGSSSQIEDPQRSLRVLIFLLTFCL